MNPTPLSTRPVASSGRKPSSGNKPGRRGVRGYASVIICLAMLSVALPPVAATAQSQLQIAFLNPSSFAEVGDTGTLIVSDKAPSSPTVGASTYRLSAWVSQTPSNGGVEFELLRGGLPLETIDAAPVKDAQGVISDTFEAHWAIAETRLDGNYTLRATVFENNVGVASVDQDVSIVRTAENAHITYPNNGSDSTFPNSGRFGTFAPLATAVPAEGAPQRPTPVGNIDNRHTFDANAGSGATWVRAFYTTSAPGAEPEWKTCGNERTNAHPVFTSQANRGVRCSLAEPFDQDKVTAVALVSNNGRGTSFDSTFNQSGDATRVLHSYAQQPTTLAILEGADATIPKTAEGYMCDPVTGVQTVVHLSDQFGREISGANIDVHASGPTDKLRFDTENSGSPVTVPDQGTHSFEPGYDCFFETDQAVGNQGEHQVLGAPDIKHVESAGNPNGSTSHGTEDTGNFGWLVKVMADQVTAEKFTTVFTVWVDEGGSGEVNNDRLDGGELACTTAHGYGQAPAPITKCFVDSTPDPEPSPEPSPDPSPEPDPTGERTITLVASKRSVERGNRVIFSGSILGEPACTDGQRVNLKAKRPGATRFRTIKTTATNNSGNYRMEARVRRTKVYKAVSPAVEICEKTASTRLRVRAI